MRKDPATQVAYRAAQAIRRDPLVALGVTGTTGQALTVGQATFVLDMENPARANERDDQHEAEALATKFAKEEDWEAALPGGSGYRGPRGEREKEQVNGGR